MATSTLTRADGGASASDVERLVSRLRGKGLDDAQVSESLQGMGYTKRQAATAVGSGSSGTSKGSSPAPAPEPAGGAGGQPASSTGSSGSPSLASFVPSVPSVSPTLTPPKRLNGGDVAGFAAGLLLYTLALNYIRYGQSGVTGWLSAKFLNRVTVGAPAGGSSAWGQQTLAPTAGADQGASSTGLVSTRPRNRKV